MSFASEALLAEMSRVGSDPRSDWDELADRSPRILLAEDDVELRGLIASKLRMLGYDVVEAKNGDELFDLLMTQHRQPPGARLIDLIISDLRMPGLTGMDVLAELRRSDSTTPFILMTAFGSAETLDQAFRAGAMAVLGKPFKLADLCTAAEELLGEFEGDDVGTERGGICRQSASLRTPQPFPSGLQWPPDAHIRVPAQSAAHSPPLPST